MYAETGSCDDDERFLSLEVSPSSSSRHRFLGKLVVGSCAAILLLAVPGGQAMWNRARAPAAGVNSKIGLDLEESKVRIPIDVLGINYFGLSKVAGNPNGAPLAVCPGANVADHERTLFTKAITCAVAKKGKISQKNIKIEESDIVSSAADAATHVPARTELSVVVTVPSEISADALMHLLSDDGDLMQDVKDTLKLHESFDPATDQVFVQWRAMEQSATKEGVFETQITPLIVVEMDVRGLDYVTLARDASLKNSFVEAVRDGIAHGSSLNSKSIELDISNGGTNGAVPFVHLTAKFGVPSGMKADATMSEWPNGGLGIGSNVQANIRKINDVDVVSTDSHGGQHEISVSTGVLRLGAVRETYETKVRAEFEVSGLHHNLQPDAVRPDAVKNKIVEMVKKQVGEDKEVEAKYLDGNEAAVKLLSTIRVQVEVSALGEDASEKASVWQAKLLPAGAAVQSHFETKNSLALVKKDYKVMVGVPTVKQQAETVDVDFVIHGVDYSHISDARKGGFLSDLGKEIRESMVTFELAPPLELTSTKDDIETTVSSSQAYSNAVNIRIHIPAPVDQHDVQVLISHLDSNIADVKSKIQERVRAMNGIKYVSSWTTDAIEVTMPGTTIS